MQDALMANWSAEPPVSGELQASLRDLNQRFLDLLAAGAAPERGAPWPDLPRRIASLTSEQKAAAANCPYALFDLKFHDDAHWRGRLEQSASGSIADSPAPSGTVAGFAQLALFYAWHVAANGALAAQLILGMNERTAAALSRVTLGRVALLASAESGNLSARWSGCNAFWAELIDAAARPDPKGLRRVQLFGLQLAAAARLQHPAI